MATPRPVPPHEQSPSGRTIAAYIRLARPKQWLKNVLVIAAPGAAGVLGEPHRAVPDRDRVRLLLPGRERHLLHQ